MSGPVSPFTSVFWGIYGTDCGYLLWFENCEMPDEVKKTLPCCIWVSGLLRVNHFSICRWITPVLLLIDFYEKTAISSKRRAQMTKVHNIVYMVDTAA